MARNQRSLSFTPDPKLYLFLEVHFFDAWRISPLLSVQQYADTTGLEPLSWKETAAVSILSETEQAVAVERQARRDALVIARAKERTPEELTRQLSTLHALMALLALRQDKIQHCIDADATHRGVLEANSKQRKRAAEEGDQEHEAATQRRRRTNRSAPGESGGGYLSTSTAASCSAPRRGQTADQEGAPPIDREFVNQIFDHLDDLPEPWPMITPWTVATLRSTMVLGDDFYMSMKD